MSSASHDNPLTINCEQLGGTVKERIAAARAAGFEQVELCGPEGEDEEAIQASLHGAGVGVSDYRAIADLDGAPEHVRTRLRAQALRVLDAAARLDATTVIASASTRPDCALERVEDDLRWLAREAAHRHQRVAYEGLAWSTFNFTLRSAWECVHRVHEPNLGVVVNAFHIFAGGCHARDMDGIPTGAIFLVQLSDLARSVDSRHLVEAARDERLLPGRGSFPLRALVDRLRDRQYRGPIGVEVFNDGLRARDAHEVAAEAMAALRAVLAA